MKEKKIMKIKRDVEKEFPGDFALQQVHIARKLLSEEAKEKNLSLWRHIKMQAKEVEKVVHDL
ncbi:hypothetical protein IBX65_00255 [Candidatus Aerophobetes bacterium]|nr:hypothetical protein [Candidatus Aerophobetes bacterium]